MSRPYLVMAVFLAVPLLGFAQIQTAADDPGVTVDAGAGLRHRAPVHYPKASIVAGTVDIEAKLNPRGEVADARVVSGPEELRKEALWSVLQWHYGPEAPAPVHIHIRFDSAAVSPVRHSNLRPSDDRGAGEDFLAGVLKTTEFNGLGMDAENELRARLPFREGDPLHHSDLAKITDIVSEFDNHLVADFTGQIAGPEPHRELTIHIHAAAPAPSVFGDSEEAGPAAIKPPSAAKK